MAQYIDTVPQQETAVLVALITPQQPKAKTEEYLDELALLAFTLGIKILTTFTQHLAAPDVKTLVGKGKLAEIETFVKAHQAMVIFDDELSPSQAHNLEAILQCKVLDRNLLILNILRCVPRLHRPKYRWS